MDSDYRRQGNQQQQQQQQSQVGSGLTRFRSAPSSFFANMLDRDFCEEFLHRPTSPETERMLIRLISSSGGPEGRGGGSPWQEEPEMKGEARDFAPQRQGQGQSCSSQQQPDVSNRMSGFRSTSRAGLDRSGQVKPGGGRNASSLIRHSSSPAGLFADINVDENEKRPTFGPGFVSMDGSRDFGSSLGNSRLNFSSSRPPPPPSSSSMGHHMSPIVEEKAFNRDHQESDFGAEYRVASWEDAGSVSESFSIFNRSSEFKASEAQNEEVWSRPPLGLTHHLSLPKTSAELSAIDKFLQIQDSVPCKLRAKRGCATHPRSIAERVRRTKISERMRKLQDLVPNMDKQTNTTDMLDLAVDYVKELQKQVKALSSQRARCTCSYGRQQLQSNHT